MIPEDEKILNQNIAAIDQSWEKLEGSYPFACIYSKNIPETLSKEERVVLQNFCTIIAWELSTRNIRKNRVLKCDLKHYAEDYSFVEVDTLKGKIPLEVKSTILSKDKDKIHVSAYRLNEKEFLIFVSTFSPTQAFKVSADQISEGE
jgi:hypothetical protein